MSVLDPRRQVSEPLRRALDALALRWLGIYVLAASVVVCPFLCGVGLHVETLAHACLPIFLLGFIVMHLHWRRAPVPRDDGWRRAFEADPGTARLTILVGGAAMAGVGAALLAIFCPLGEPMALTVALGIWFPILAPLYGTAIWLAIECSMRRLGREANSADRRFRQYWHDIAGGAPHRSGRSG